MPRIEKWAIRPNTTSPYVAPECRETVLTGTVYGHPRIDDGEEIVTSRLVSIDTGAGVAHTRNTTYELGSPDPKFLEWLGHRGSSLEDYNS